MGRIIAIANQKGGVGKTTTSINLSSCIAAKGKKVLVVDIDPQGNTTSGYGIEKNDLDNTIYELMLGDCSIEDCIIKDVIENISILPSNVNLAAAEIELIGVDKKEYILKNEIDWVKDRYDYIIIDCPPSLSLLTVNAMTTADSVLVPIQCEYYALEGLSQLIHTVNLVKERLNPNLEMEGVVFTMYDSRTNLSAQVVENVKSHLNQKVYRTVIPRNIRLAEAPSYGQPINIYDPKSAGAESYLALAEEVIGKGLDALIPAGDKKITKEENTKGAETVVKITKVEPNRSQPRKNFDEDALQELADSIKQFGLLQPILVQDKGEYYEIIAGERRWRAAKLAGLKEVPVIIRNYSSQEIVEISLIENIQREDLNPIEEAQAYKRLLTEFNLKQDEVAERVSKSRTAVTNSMRLLKLCDGVQQMIIDDMLSTGHARALIPIEDPELQLQLAQRIFDEKLSVREVEKLVKSILKPAEEKPKKEEIPQSLMYIYQNIENKLKDKLSRKVAISPKGKNGSGKIEIEFYSNDDLEKLIEILSK